MEGHAKPMAGYRATHFRYEAPDDGRVATITLDRPERKNPLTFDAYAELRDLFRALAHASDVKAVGDRGCRRQLLFGRRRARDHRAPHAHGCARAPRVHAHDRRPREGHPARAAAGGRGRRRRVRRGRRDDRARRRRAPRDAAREGGVPVRARRAGRRTWAPARCFPHDRPGTRGGPAGARPRDERGGGRRLGLYQRVVFVRARARRRAGATRGRSPPGRPSHTR